MTEYICKYTPAEILAGFGEESVLCNPSVESFEPADSVMHRNVCSFSRALIAHRLENDGGALVLTDCCDSIRRTRDVLLDRNQKVFLLDLPHKDGPCARRLYQDELLKFLDEYGAYTGKQFSTARFRAACGTAAEKPDGPHIVVMGARMSGDLLSYIRSASPLPVLNHTCTGTRRIGGAPDTDNIMACMDWYAGELLSQPPCMRMTEISPRRALISDPGLRGIVYNTVSFCDYYGFEYARLRKETSVPMLKLETDYTMQAVAQFKNRLDAFFENLLAPADAHVSRSAGSADEGRWFTAGIDSGSTSTNAVILDDRRNMVSFSVVPTGVSISESAEKALDLALKQEGISRTRVLRTVSTGYGRAGIGLGNRDVTEITCHAKGAYFWDPGVRTVIDIGGQDSKVICLDETGAVRDFAMNDKCAAGTGRFLEMMAQSLGISLAEMSVCGLSWDEEINITSMCSVFAQSEVVSLIAAGKKLPDIVHGLNLSVASRVVALSGRTGLERSYMMTGGVAKNAGVVRAVEEKLAHPVLVSAEPEICGALGAALIAWEDENASRG